MRHNIPYAWLYAKYIASNGAKNNTHTPYTMKQCC